MKVLITGFEPFGNSSINPSQILVENAEDHFPGGIELVKAILPVEKSAGPQALVDALLRHQPDAVICFGLAEGRSAISLERIAVNLMDYRMPDNAGETVQNQPVFPNGPAAYFSTLPLLAMHGALQAQNIPVVLSLTAGSYLCNQIFYTLMHHLATHGQSIPPGLSTCQLVPSRLPISRNPSRP